MYGHNYFLTQLTARWRLAWFNRRPHIRRGWWPRSRGGQRRRWGSGGGLAGDAQRNRGILQGMRRGLGWFMLVVVPGLLVVSLLSFQQLDRKFAPLITKLATIQAKQIAVETINQVIQEKIVDNPQYQNLMLIHKDKDNRPVLIQPDVMKLQKLQSTALVEVNKALEALSSKELAIPMGMLLNSNLLADMGPDMHVSFRPKGVVDLEVINDFQQAGINQTRQIISLKINTEMTVVAPLLQDTIKVATVVKVADNIIIGETPSVLFNK